MFKRLIVILFISSFLLTGCLSPASVSVVDDMYTQALLEEEEALASYFSEEFLNEHPLDQLTEELAGHVRDVGGTNLLNTVELRPKELNPEIVEELDQRYDVPWYFIVNDADGENIMTWVVIKTSTQYQIVEGEKLNRNQYNEDIKN